MTVSMTGFAARRGQGAGHSWGWDIRSVNGKGLDLRLRVPDWIDGLELALRGELAKALSRGNVSLSLRVARDGMGDGAEGLRVNAPALAAVLTAMSEVEQAAMAAGVTLAQGTAADVLAVRGVLDTTAVEIDTAPLRAAILADLARLLADFATMRAAEGAALQGVIAGQLEALARLTADAAREAAARREATAAGLREALAKVLANAEGVDETRLAQELALIAVKNDVTEELDRLAAHIGAARALLAEPGPVGRKFDFLMQEFMREANTLCSKAQSLALTRIGLDLKTVIDQMREQVQNVE
ncbi:YicC/YloC family endoribonuclease [Tabrizicola oligotrophica]|uniref:YicC family protein n=1 Tax=Tabrizicola oligotrophica TaxID=2710650 RepID=A0A6M0QQB4_9RHOB|nr:YicC/YloC family endoribonuclease [Tabrizicola oligotrophica]NEY88843.1 YicC family protein [Tabrizicola oligotrophica]